MRHIRPSIWLGGIITLLVITVQVGVSQNRLVQSDSAVVSGSGCVEKGVEARCLVLQDKESGTGYSLFFPGPAPAIGSGIRFTGKKVDVSICMQGQPVKVTSWSAVKMDCRQRKH